MFLQTQGLLCKTGFDSQAQRPQVPVGRQAEAGVFVCLPWRLRNKAWDKASPGFRQSSLSKQARAGTAEEAVARISLASPSSTWPVQGISGLLSLCVWLFHINGKCCWISMLSWWSTGSQNPCWGIKWVKLESRTESKRWGGKSTDPESTGPRT